MSWISFVLGIVVCHYWKRFNITGIIKETLYLN